MVTGVSTNSHFMPPQATDLARSVDSLYGFLLVVSLISCVLVIGGLIYFAAKYRRKSENEKTPYISHNSTLEFLWSFIPFVIMMIVFVWGWVVYSGLRTMPKDALEIAVQGQKWNWSFTYKNGRTSAAELYVPVDQDVKLVMNSVDVIHSFYIPAFRYKQDVVPGRYTSLWFHVNQAGDYQVFCAEYCGDMHSGMMAKIHALPREKFEEWLGAGDPYKDMAALDIGRKVYSTRCIACHNLTDQVAVGPGWKGLFGSTANLMGGTTAVVDENYVRQKMMNPSNSTVAEFKDKKGVMTSFAGQLSEAEISGVIELFKSLK